MKYSAAMVSVLVAGAVAVPAATKTESSDTLPTIIKPLFGPKNHVYNAICPKLPLPTHGPLPNGFPTAHQLGSIISPALNATVGDGVVENIDKIADQLCVSSQRSGEGNGICQDTFAAANAFVQAKTPLGHAKEFGCLLHLLCIANTGPKQQGTCNKLLGEADCTANVLVGVKPTECDK